MADSYLNSSDALIPVSADRPFSSRLACNFYITHVMISVWTGTVVQQNARRNSKHQNAGTHTHGTSQLFQATGLMLHAYEIVTLLGHGTLVKLQVQPQESAVLWCVSR